MRVQESYTPNPLGLNATFNLAGPCVSGFLAVTAGTITVTDRRGTVLLNAYPVAAGTFNKISMMSEFLPGGTVVLAGGASGTLLV